jgi:ABC-type transporter Mla maintaining outer membrane lipid asymmetry ATPase subunit MlaF
VVVVVVVYMDTAKDTTVVDTVVMVAEDTVVMEAEDTVVMEAEDTVVICQDCPS